MTRNPQVSQDPCDPQLYCGSEWSSPFWPAILIRRIAYIKIRMCKSVFFCSRPSHEFEKTALFILSTNKGAFCAYICLIFDWRLGKTKDNFYDFPVFTNFLLQETRVWYRRLWKIFCKSYPISISNYLHNFLSLPFTVFKQLNFLFIEGGGKTPHPLPLNR